MPAFGQSVLPEFPGLSWGQKLSPTFNTSVKTAVSGMEYRSRNAKYPTWKFSMKYEVLRDVDSLSEFQQLVGFYILRQGSFESFLYLNPNDNAVTDQVIAQGDGQAVNFQLVRSWGYGSLKITEPVHNISSKSIYLNGVLKTEGTDYTLSSTGLVMFNTPPSTIQTITWSGTYYYRCRFAEDSAEFQNIMGGLWSLGSLSFYGSVMNKV